MPAAAHKFHAHQALKYYIEDAIQLDGPACDLNHFDVSEIDDFSNLFSGSTAHFVGNISSWDVSNATNMHRTFDGSCFNGDISKWRPVKAERMDHMFAHSQFNGDISMWRTPRLHDTSQMFQGSPFTGSLSGWTFGNVTTADFMFRNCPFSGDASRWDVARLPMKDAVGMFDPTFKGVLPRVGKTSIQRREFYRGILNTETNTRGLANYLDAVPFNSVHLDIAMAAHQKPIGMSQEDFQWIKDIQRAGQGLGLTDGELLDYALEQYHHRDQPSWHGVDFGAME